MINQSSDAAILNLSQSAYTWRHVPPLSHNFSLIMYYQNDEIRIKQVLGYNVESQPKFRRNISLPSSRSKNKPRKKPAWKQAASRDITFHNHRCENLKSYKLYFVDGQIKLSNEWKCNSESFDLAMLFSPHWCLGENMTSYLKMATVQGKIMCVLWISKQSPLWKRSIVTERNMDKIHFR
jgi:hypothetical protein